MDLFARKIIACKVSNKLDRFLAIETLREAVGFRGISMGILFHTDKGVSVYFFGFQKENRSTEYDSIFFRQWSSL